MHRRLGAGEEEVSNMIITICGSMNFITKIKSLKKELEETGIKVFYPKENDDIDYDNLAIEQRANMKHSFIDDHLDKIRKSDAVLIANYNKNGIKNYIGANTFLEMGFAYVLGKKIFILNDIPIQPNEVEIRGLKPVLLKGNLSF